MNAITFPLIADEPGAGRVLGESVVHYQFDERDPAIICQSVVLSNNLLDIGQSVLQSVSGKWGPLERLAMFNADLFEVCLVGDPDWIDATAKALDGATATPLAIPLDLTETDAETIRQRLDTAPIYEWRHMEEQRSLLSRKAPPRAVDLKSKMVLLGSVAPVLKINYALKGWLGQGAMSVIYGPSNAGKTFVALDMAMHVAAGKPWRGCKVKGGPVLYIAAEGGSGILNRLAAFAQENPDMSDAPFMVLPTSLDLHGEGDATALCEALDENPVLIVVDTLARSMGDGDENATKDMGAFVRSCDRLRDETGAHVMVIHHTGKDESRGARGAYALKAAVDTEIQLTAGHEIICKKQRDMRIGDTVHFALRTITLGEDEDGDPVTSCVVDDAAAPVSTPKPLKGKNQVAMSALHDAMRDHGQAMSGPDYPSGCKAVLIDHWRDACAVHGLTTGATPAAARMAFKRAKDGLIEKDVVRIYGEYVWEVTYD